MDVGLIGAGILSGVLGAHIVSALRERFSLGTWTDSLLGAVGGGLCCQIAILSSSAWTHTSAGYAIGRIALVVATGIVGGAVLLVIVGLFRPRRNARSDDDETARTCDDGHQEKARLSETDI